MKVSFAHNQAQRRPGIGHTWVVVIQRFLHADVSALQFLFSLGACLKAIVIGQEAVSPMNNSTFLQWMMQPEVKF